MTNRLVGTTLDNPADPEPQKVIAYGRDPATGALTPLPASSTGDPVSIADGAFVTFGAKADAANQDPTTTDTFMAFIKGLLGLTGSKTETAPATDIASSGLNGRLQRIAQRITSLIAQIPATLGQKASAASLAVVGASDEAVLANQANQTAVQTPVAPATATATKAVLLGGQFNSTQPTFTDGQQGRLSFDARGMLKAGLYSADSSVQSKGNTAIADGNSNTQAAIFALNYPLIFNGTTWDRAPGNTNGGYMQGPVADAAASAGNPLSTGGIYNSTLPTYTNGQRSTAQFGSRGSQNVTLFGPDSTNSVGAGSVTDAQAGSTGLSTRAQTQLFNATTWDRATKPNATSRIISAANSNNATSAKASAGNLNNIIGYNAGTATYLKFYNKASAPAPGSDTPVLTFYLPANTAFAFDIPNGGQYFATGIAYALVTGNADNDNTSVAAAAVLGLNVLYS